MARDKGLGRVVVVGNGFAGLLTAAVLAQHADHVTIVDRDHVPDQVEPRPGVPQGRHIHVLLAAGQRALEELLPGVLAELDRLHVPAVESPTDIVETLHGRWMRRAGAGVAFLTPTRPLLEHVVRQRVLTHPRIEMMNSVEAVGFMGDRGRVQGLLIQRRGAGARPEPEPLRADLVVDASGRSSHTPQWLAAIDAPQPDEERIDSGLCYSTRVYHAPVHPGYKGIYLIPSPDQPRGAVVMPTETPGHFLVTLSGLAADAPPTDAAGFEAFAKGLPQPIVYDWIMAAQPQGPPMGFRGTANVRRRYDKLGGRPRGLLVVGDAACSFNPVYGQGITVAALGTVALRDALARGNRSTKQLQKLVIEAATSAWTISSGSDKKMPGATGNAIKPAPADRFADWYLGRVEAHAPANLTVSGQFQNVLHLLAPATALFAWPVLRVVLFGRVKPGPAEPPLYPESTAA
jgi:2-polyprenyl-6-methoxyphenol hydroxylase-like FAD-dependent oxidoreductase